MDSQEAMDAPVPHASAMSKSSLGRAACPLRFLRLIRPPDRAARVDRVVLHISSPQARFPAASMTVEGSKFCITVFSFAAESSSSVAS